MRKAHIAICATAALSLCALNLEAASALPADGSANGYTATATTGKDEAIPIRMVRGGAGRAGLARGGLGAGRIGIAGRGWTGRRFGVARVGWAGRRFGVARIGWAGRPFYGRYWGLRRAAWGGWGWRRR